MVDKGLFLAPSNYTQITLMLTPPANTDYSNQPYQAPIPYFNNEPVLILILGFITCGLYLIYWNIKAADVLNAVAGRPVISPPVAVLAGCCFPVNIYFYYVASRDALPKVYERIGEPNRDQTTLLVVLGFLFPMVAAMIVQSDINKLYQSK